MTRYDDDAERALDREDPADAVIEARKEARVADLWPKAQARTGTQRGDLIAEAAGLPALRRHWLDGPAAGDPRAAALHWLRYAREMRRGVEAAGVRQPAIATFHEAATMAARTFARAYLDGNTQPVWVGAFALLCDREKRARTYRAEVAA